MYVLVATNHKTKKIDISNHVSIKNVFNNKRIKDNRNELTLVFNKCYPKGTQPIIELMRKHMLEGLSFGNLLNLYDKIELIEKGII